MKIVVYPHPVLRKQSLPVSTFDSSLARYADSMYHLMLDSQGIGIAAPQTGSLQQLTIIDIGNGRLNLVNPTILSFSQLKMSDREGCLSIPHVYADISRSQSISIQAYDLKGQQFSLSASDLLARVIQHEIDHLNGILFIDYLNQKQKESIQPQLIKLQNP